MNIEIIVILLLVIIAALVGYLYIQSKSHRNKSPLSVDHRANEEIATLKAEKAALENNLTERTTQLQKSESDCDQLRQQLSALELNHREQQTRLTAEQDKLRAMEEQFDKQKSELKNEFKVLSEEIFEQRQKALHEQNKVGIGALVKPLQEQITQFQRRVNEVHSETIKGHTSLEAEIKKVMDVGIKMGADADNLSSALKGDAQQRGAWGEAQLERTLEISGLVKDDHYKKQAAFKDAQGKQKFIDYLVLLPNKQHIVIDSKVSLLAYDKAVAANDESERTMAMNEHIKAIKKHIDDLAAKDYTDSIGINSPNYVLMFMPIESAYIEALKWSKDLYHYGYSKNIILVSHTTLIPILRVVANLWMLEQGNREAREIGDKAGDIYNSVCTVAERIQRLGKTLNTASNHYNDAVTAISGQQGLEGKVARFTRLSIKAKKQMPKLQPRHFEYKTKSLDIEPLATENLSETEADK